MSLNHVYEPQHQASEIVRALRVVEGPAAIEMLRDVLDLAYIKGKLDGVTDALNVLPPAMMSITDPPTLHARGVVVDEDGHFVKQS